jgi:hypothetical protein
VTQHTLKDCGFVENYPRRWLVDSGRKAHGEILVIEVDVVDSGEHVLRWPLGSGRPNPKQLNWIFAQFSRLRNVESKIESGLAELESDHERSVIREYYHGYMEALLFAMLYREHGLDNSSDSVFDDLTAPKGIGVEGLNLDICLSNPSDRGYTFVKTTESQYQQIKFYHNVGSDNTCLTLSGWIQACSNFRPHYHEAVVHVPAQYVSDVKRVLFMGGGDNMILHEILKYPNLELVVGLELDQQVCRSSFKHLGTLPYFDDHRVHWYFGDATKSLFALPRSYFGTFDLVLIDLQTFVADTLRVTDTLTIMDTAMLLMKQEGGVIAKNEDFPVRINTGFARYTVDLEMHDVPHICQQSITIGSNSVDFFKANSISHGVDTLAIDLPTESTNVSSQKSFAKWYNYRQTKVDNCSADLETSNKNQKEDPPVGLFVVLEAENLSLSLDANFNVQDAIIKALEGYEFALLGQSIGAEMDDKLFVCVMKECYVTARVFADKKYIAFDIAVWQESVAQIDDVMESLMTAVGGDLQKASTSYRFVTPGIYGLNDVKKDFLNEISADIRELHCRIDSEQFEMIESDGSPNLDITAPLFDALIDFLMPQQGEGLVPFIGVLCGVNNSTCRGLNDLQKLAQTSGAKIEPLYSCASFDDLEACEKSFKEVLHLTTAQQKKFDALILDDSLQLPMAQVVEKVLRDKVAFHSLVEEKILVLTRGIPEDSWRHILLDRFRTDMVLFDPAYLVRLQTSSPSGKEKSVVEVCLFSSGDQNFFQNLASAIENFESITETKVTVQEVANGIINYVADFEVKEFNNSDYDRTRSRQQWLSQQPMGHQSLFLMGQKQPKTAVEMGERILAEVEPGPWEMMYAGAVVKQKLDNQHYVVKYDKSLKVKTLNRDQIRKFSESDKDMSLRFQIGDVIFYRNAKNMYVNGVISKQEEDGTYSIYLLDTTGDKIYHVPRNRLMYQFESPDFIEEIPALTSSKVETSFLSALDVAYDGTRAMETFEIGDGAVMVAVWSVGSAILKWDGKYRIDINVFTYDENEKRKKLDLFEKVLKSELEYLVRLSRDEHPRGCGSVVNFASDLIEPPFWLAEAGK